MSDSKESGAEGHSGWHGGGRKAVQLPARVIASIDSKISSEGCYDAQQVVRTLYHRYMAKQEYAMAIELCRHFALKFASLHQEELAVDLGMSLLSCLEQEDLFNENFVPEVLELFNAMAHAGGTGRGKYAFINRAIHHSCSPEQPYGDVRLHRAAADIYWRDGRYGLCQGHLIFCRDAPALVMMLRQWQKEGYVRERPLFWLRVVLILLCLKDIDTAENVLRLSGQNWDSPYVRHRCTHIIANKHYYYY